MPFALFRSRQDHVQALMRSSIARGHISRRYRPVAVRCRSFDNWPRPSVHQCVGRPRNIRCHPFALGVEKHDTAEFGLFENSRIDVQCGQDVEYVPLYVQSWK